MTRMYPEWLWLGLGLLLAPTAAWSQTADLSLRNAIAQAVQTTDTAWLLEEVGALSRRPSPRWRSQASGESGDFRVI